MCDETTKTLNNLIYVIFVNEFGTEVLCSILCMGLFKFKYWRVKFDKVCVRIDEAEFEQGKLTFPLL